MPDFGNQPIELGKTAAAPPRDAMDTTDYVETKLDLATAYLDMGDQVGARGLLEEVLSEGGASQKQRATDLLKKSVEPSLKDKAKTPPNGGVLA